MSSVWVELLIILVLLSIYKTSPLYLSIAPNPFIWVPCMAPVVAVEPGCESESTLAVPPEGEPVRASPFTKLPGLRSCRELKW